MHMRREVLDEEGECLVDRPRLDQMVVVEDEHGVQVGDLVQQGGQDRLDRRCLRRSEQRQDDVSGTRMELVYRRNEVAPEPRRVVVAGFQQQPRNGLIPRKAAYPYAEQGALAESRRGRNEGELLPQPLLELPDQTRSGHVRGTHRWNGQPGQQQLIAPRSRVRTPITGVVRDRIRERSRHGPTIAAGQRRRDLVQPGEGDILRFAEIRLVELASPLEVGDPVLAPTRPAFLAGGVSESRTPERKRARRRISKPGSPGGGSHPDPRITSQPGDVEYPVCHVGSAPRHAYPAKLPKLPNMLGGV